MCLHCHLFAVWLSCLALSPLLFAFFPVPLVWFSLGNPACMQLLSKWFWVISKVDKGLQKSFFCSPLSICSPDKALETILLNLASFEYIFINQTKFESRAWNFNYQFPLQFFAPTVTEYEKVVVAQWGISIFEKYNGPQLCRQQCTVSCIQKVKMTEKTKQKGGKNRQDGLYESHKRWLSSVLEKTK